MAREYHKHGQRNTRLYKVWKGVKSRCYNPRHTAYHRYGGRGIVMCDEWKNNFVSFYDWAMKNGYEPTAPHGQCTLDRLDNEGNYSPTNCRWVSSKIQAYNRSDNHYIEYNGEIHTVVEWAKILGLKKNTLIARLSRGWSLEKALSPKLKKQPTKRLQTIGETAILSNS